MENQDPTAAVFEKLAGEKLYSFGEDIPAPTEQTPPAETPAAEADDAKEVEIYNKFFEKRFGKKEDEVKSVLSRKSFDEEALERLGKPLNEVEEFIKNPPKPKELRSEYSKRLEEYLEKGGDEKTFHDLQRTNWDEISIEDVLKSELKAKYPKADKAKIDTLYKAEYRVPKPLDPEKYTEEEIAERNEEIEIANTKLELAAERIREERKDFVIKELAKPFEQKPLLSKEEEEAMRKAVAIREESTAKALEALSKYTSYGFEIVEGEKGKEVTANVTYEVTPEQKNQIETIVKNPSLFMSLFLDKEGRLEDTQGWLDIVTLRVAGKDAISKMATDYAHAKMEAFIKGQKNANFKSNEQNVPPSAQAKRDSELIKHVTGN